MRLENIYMPKTAEHLRAWTIQLMLEGTTPPTTYNTIKSWADNEEAKQTLETIPMI